MVRTAALGKRGTNVTTRRARATMLQRFMNHEPSNHATLSDKDLLIEVHRLAGCERDATARLVAALCELDARRLYLAEGCSSLFTYCTQVLHLSEHAAYGRIEAARAAQTFPIILELLADGSLHVTAVALLRSHLTMGNHRDVLASARHKSKRQIEEIVAAMRPRPAVPASVRKLPPPVTIRPKPDPTGVTASAVRVTESGSLGEACETSAEGACQGTDAGPVSARASVPGFAAPIVEQMRPALIQPLAPERYKVQFTASRSTYDALREAQDLLRHQIPDGDVAAIVDRALTLLVAELHRTRHAATRGCATRRAGTAREPSTTTASSSASVRQTSIGDRRGRHIPAAVRREVWTRDGGQCAFAGTSGRCTERGFLEYHHVVPFADGGAAVADNLELRCRAHNAYEAERWFGVTEEELAREPAGIAGRASDGRP
jgi:5-methylcytosine-specific restriction endonuclease McrA